MVTSNPIPSAFFGAGYAYSTNAITLNTEAHASPLLEELEAAEANATTGDYRRILYALMEMMYQKFLVVTPVPGKLTFTRSTYEDTSTGELVRTYTFQVRTIPTGVEVAEE